MKITQTSFERQLSGVEPEETRAETRAATDWCAVRSVRLLD